jgi:1-acyl-sn-glycerol-3-phosphate acyltransferase
MAYWLIKVILTPVLRVLYRVDVRGARNVPKRGPVILASNHQSFIDSIFIPLVVRRRVTFIAKAEYFENRRTAWFFRAVGQIPVKRGGGSASERALISAREVLEAGGVLGIYPEGTRSTDGRLYRGHTGVARLALQCGATVVPVSLGGTAAVQPRGAMRPKVFRRVTVRIGPPMVWPGRVGDAQDPAALRAVTDEIMDAIAALSGQERVMEYARQRTAHQPPGTPVRSVPGPPAVADLTTEPIAVLDAVDVSDPSDPAGPQGGPGERVAAAAAVPGPVGGDRSAGAERTTAGPDPS